MNKDEIAGYTDEYSVKMIATALADALESKP